MRQPGSALAAALLIIRAVGDQSVQLYIEAEVLVRPHLAEYLERCEERAGPLPEFVKGGSRASRAVGDFELRRARA